MTWLELHCSCPVLPQDGHPLLQQLQERLPPLLLPLPAPGRPGRDLRPGAGHRLPDSGRHAGLRGQLRSAGDHPQHHSHSQFHSHPNHIHHDFCRRHPPHPQGKPGLGSDLGAGLLTAPLLLAARRDPVLAMLLEEGQVTHGRW